MTSQPITSSRPAPIPVRRRRIRTAAAITAIAALIATGGYLATTTIGPDAAPTTPAARTDVNPSAQVQRNMHQSIAGQYGNGFAARTVVNPRAQTRRELRESTTGQYGSQASPNARAHPDAQVRRQLRQSIVGQYGPAR
jgi:hypothetical protein